MSHAANKRENMEALERHLLTGWYTPTELAQFLECTRATVHNYLNELKQTHELINEDGSYHLDPLQYIENVRLTQFEAIALYLALRRFIRQTSTSPSFFLSAIRKISSALRPTDLVIALMQSSESLEPQRIAVPEKEKVWKLLIQAWIERIPVRLEYQKGRNNRYEVGIYEFDPYLFEPAVLGYGTYVLGWCSSRQALRTFKVDRIQRVTLLTGVFTRREELSPDVLLRHAWEVWYGEQLVEVVLRFIPQVAPRVLETVWHPLQEIETNEDGSITWSVKVVQWLELVPWIRGWGHEVEVIAPRELRAQIAESMRRAAALYGD